MGGENTTNRSSLGDQRYGPLRCWTTAPPSGPQHHSAQGAALPRGHSKRHRPGEPLRRLRRPPAGGPGSERGRGPGPDWSARPRDTAMAGGKSGCRTWGDRTGPGERCCTLLHQRRGLTPSAAGRWEVPRGGRAARGRTPRVNGRAPVDGPAGGSPTARPTARCQPPPTPRRGPDRHAANRREPPCVSRWARMADPRGSAAPHARR